MKKLLIALLCCMGLGTTAVAQSAADKVVGNYAFERSGNKSKAKIFKVGDGYRAQIYWLEKDKNADGTPKTDIKNPDESKRKTPASKIVLIDKVYYDAKADEWSGGKIYDATTGKTYKVELKFKDANTLKVKGKLGPFSDTVEWRRVKE